MICPRCNNENDDDANFCPVCGKELDTLRRHNDVYEAGAEEPDEITDEASVARFSFAEMFSNVFKRHTEEDAESLFLVGTASTTLDIHKDEILLPRPWLFARFLITVPIIYLGFYTGLMFFGNLNFLPGLIMLGAFLSPVALLIFFWEINVLANISFYRLSIIFLVGGLAALLYTVLLYSVIDGYGSPLMIGFIEETAKVLALVLFARKSKYRFIINGLLIGAAVGTGFSAFESSGYIFITALQYGVSVMLKTTFWRAILAPGGHIAWAALTGAAIMMVKKDGKFRLRMLLRPKFLGVYVLVILLHALWDTDLPQPVLMNIPLYPLILTIVSWIILFAFIKRGLKQILKYKSEKETLQTD